MDEFLDALASLERSFRMLRRWSTALMVGYASCSILAIAGFAVMWIVDAPIAGILTMVGLWVLFFLLGRESKRHALALSAWEIELDGVMKMMLEKMRETAQS